MSKAFTKDDEAAPAIVPPRASLPPGVPNYVTARGLAALRQEHVAIAAERARIDALGAEFAREHAAVAERLAALDERLGSAELVENTNDDELVIRFGARVVVADEDGHERTFEIVGVDEADPARGLLAFVAPLAKALLGHRIGDEVTVRTPRGKDVLEVRAVRYGDG